MSEFEDEFLENYLQFGLGSMPKSDVDALVMHLLDKYGSSKFTSMANQSNQAVSELLKTPVSKVKKCDTTRLLSSVEELKIKQRVDCLSQLAMPA